MSTKFAIHILLSNFEARKLYPMKQFFILITFLFLSIQGFSQAFSHTDFTYISGASVSSSPQQDGGFDTNINILGGEIDYVVTSTNGNTLLSVTGTNFFMGFEIAGDIEIVWDGVDGDPFNIDHSGTIAALGSCGDVSIGFNKTAFPTLQLDFDLTIEFYNSATSYITWTGPVSLLSGPLMVDVNTSQFQSVGSVFDFNNVTAIRLVLSTSNGSNVTGLIESFSWVPDLSPTTPCDPMPAAAIPTLGQWGFIILLLGCAILGYVVLFWNEQAKRWV